MLCAENIRKRLIMTINNDRKTYARNLARLLDINYTAGLRLADTAKDVFAAKAAAFPTETIQEVRWDKTLIEVEYFHEELVESHWNWTPMDGFTHYGKAAEPIIDKKSNRKWADLSGMNAFTAFSLGAGNRPREKIITRSFSNIGKDIAHFYDGSDASLLARLGFAVRGTGWHIQDYGVQQLVFREIAVIFRIYRSGRSARNPDGS
jgi:hypothetical protein